MTTDLFPPGLTVAVGSTNPAKVAAVEKVFGRIVREVKVRPVAVVMPPEIGEMPVGEQVKLGAIHRAKGALSSEDAFGVGLEGGVEFVDGECYLFNWAVVMAKDGRMGAAPSAKLLLPVALAEAIRSGKVLGDLMVERVGRSDVNAKEGAVGYLTRGLIDRQRFFEECLALALAPFLRPDEYSDGREP